MQTGLGAALGSIGQSLDPLRFSQAVQGFQAMEDRRRMQEMAHKSFAEFNQRAQNDENFRGVYQRFLKENPTFDPNNLQEYKQLREKLNTAVGVKGDIDYLVSQGVLDSDMAGYYEKQILRNPKQVSQQLLTSALGHAQHKKMLSKFKSVEQYIPEEHKGAMSALAAEDPNAAFSATAQKIVGSMGRGAVREEEVQAEQEKLAAQARSFETLFNSFPANNAAVQEYIGPVLQQLGLGTAAGNNQAVVLMNRMFRGMDKEEAKTAKLATADTIFTMLESDRQYLPDDSIDMLQTFIDEGQPEAAIQYGSQMMNIVRARKQGEVDTKAENKVKAQLARAASAEAQKIVTARSEGKYEDVMTMINESDLGVDKIARQVDALEDLLEVESGDAADALREFDVTLDSATSVYESALSKGYLANKTDPDDIKEALSKALKDDPLLAEEGIEKHLSFVARVAATRQAKQFQIDSQKKQDYSKGHQALVEAGKVHRRINNKQILEATSGGLKFRTPVDSKKVFSPELGTVSESGVPNINLVTLKDQPYIKIGDFLKGSDGSFKRLQDGKLVESSLSDWTDTMARGSDVQDASTQTIIQQSAKGLKEYIDKLSGKKGITPAMQEVLDNARENADMLSRKGMQEMMIPFRGTVEIPSDEAATEVQSERVTRAAESKAIIYSNLLDVIQAITIK